jgi:hypothetical protein
MMLVGYKGVASQIFPSSLYPECFHIISILSPFSGDRAVRFDFRLRPLGDLGRLHRDLWGSGGREHHRRSPAHVTRPLYRPWGAKNQGEPTDWIFNGKAMEW